PIAHVLLSDQVKEKLSFLFWFVLFLLDFKPKVLGFAEMPLLTKTIFFFLHNIYKMRSKCIVFRGHGFSLLALAKGVSTLFAKNGFSRPSLEQFCGVFRHVLFPQESTGLRSKQPS